MNTADGTRSTRRPTAAALGGVALLLIALAALSSCAQALQGFAALPGPVDHDECALSAQIAAEEDPGSRAAHQQALIGLLGAKAAAAAEAASKPVEAGGGGGSY